MNASSLLATLTDALHLLISGDGELWRIVFLSLSISGAATVLAALVGLPAGVLLASRRFPGRTVLTMMVETGMALPPVLVGLVVMMLLWRSGPFGLLDLLFTPAAMVFAQFIVAVPVTAGLTRSAVAALDPDIIEALDIDGAGPVDRALELLRAARPQVFLAIGASFGRAVSEVGASMMVGGNILGQTRVLTTAIALEAGRGEFARGIALGAVLLAVALLVNSGLAVARQSGAE
jgi:ABC-type tungstate transport system substrate-binding protein